MQQKLVSNFYFILVNSYKNIVNVFRKIFWKYILMKKYQKS